MNNPYKRGDTVILINHPNLVGTSFQIMDIYGDGLFYDIYSREKKLHLIALPRQIEAKNNVE